MKRYILVTFRVVICLLLLLCKPKVDLSIFLSIINVLPFHDRSNEKKIEVDRINLYIFKIVNL